MAHPHTDTPVAQPGDPIELETSVAGEEDPGASIDMATQQDVPMAPGDEAPPGTPGTGEKPCPRCGGSGRQGASACPECQGTGKINAGVGGA